MIEDVATLRKAAGRYELIYPGLGLIVRGPYVEWVLEAAAEIVGHTEKLRADGKIEELETLKEFGETTEIEVDAARFDTQNRFEAVPQCIISMGDNDYRWVAPTGRKPPEDKPLARLHDMSLTRNDSFLQDR